MHDALSGGGFSLTPATPAVLHAKLKHWQGRGVLIYGPRKAGTSLFQSLLDGLDDTVVYPTELKIKYFTRNNAGQFEAADYYRKSRVRDVRASGFDKVAYERIWFEALRSGHLKTLEDCIKFDIEVVRKCVASMLQEPQLWLTKDVGGPADDIVANWRRMFPDGKLLLIVRDPRMITRAVLNDRRRNGVRLSLREIVFQVLDPMTVVTALAKYLGDPDVHMVAYEDLVADTAVEMRRIATFLGAKYSPILARPTVFGETQVVRTSSRNTTSIFSPAASWTDALTWRERQAISLVHRIAQSQARYGVDYPALRAGIAAKNKALDIRQDQVITQRAVDL